MFLYMHLFCPYQVFKLLVPIWVMLFVFQPTPQVIAENDDLIPALTDDGVKRFSTFLLNVNLIFEKTFVWFFFVCLKVLVHIYPH